MTDIYLLAAAIWIIPNVINPTEKIEILKQITTTNTRNTILDTYKISKKDFDTPQTNDTIIWNENIENIFNTQEYINKIKNTILWGTTIELENILNDLSKDNLKELQQYILWYKDGVNKSEYPIWSTTNTAGEWRVLWWGALSLQIKNVIDTENWRQKWGLDRASGQPFFFIKNTENWIKIILRSNRVTYYPKMENWQYFHEKQESIIDYPVIILTYQWDKVYLQKATDLSDASSSTKTETKKSKSEWKKNYIINQSRQKEYQTIYDKHIELIQEYNLSKKNEKILVDKLDELSNKYKKNNELFSKEADKLLNTAENYKKIENWKKAYNKYNSIKLDFDKNELEAIRNIKNHWLLSYLKEDINNEKIAIAIYKKNFKILNIKTWNKFPLFKPSDLSTKSWSDKIFESINNDINNIKFAHNNWAINDNLEDINKSIENIAEIKKIMYNQYSIREKDNPKITRFFKDNF